MVSVSFLVPTAGRPDLELCLRSIAFQLGSDDEVLVIGDTCDGPLRESERLVRSFGSQFRYLEHNAGRHDYGHAQMNAGMTHAAGDYLSFNDDDDVWVPGAVQTIHATIASYPGVPLLFRFVNGHGFLCWVQEGVFAQDYLGGHCLVVRNDPSKLGYWQPRYAGDWDFVEQTVACYGGPTALRWLDDVLVIARPDERIRAEIRRLSHEVWLRCQDRALGVAA